MKALLLFLLFPVLVFAQNKSQKIESVFKDFTIETENNMFSHKQDLNILNFDVTDKDLQLNKEFYYQKSNVNPFDYKFEKRSLHGNPLYDDYEYQIMGGAKGMFYTNLIGGLTESVFGELSIKL